MNSFEEVEKAAAAREARDALGQPHRHNSRAGEIEAALTYYLAKETHRVRRASFHAADAGEPGKDSDESS